MLEKLSMGLGCPGIALSLLKRLQINWNWGILVLYIISLYIHTWNRKLGALISRKSNAGERRVIFQTLSEFYFKEDKWGNRMIKRDKNSDQ